MKRLALVVACSIGIFVEPAISQGSPDASFSVASVRRNPHFTFPAVRDREDERGVTYTYIPLRNVFLKAYRIQPYQFVGPSWLGSEHYDINARAPEGATVAQIPGMLRRLLSERFGAAVHWENREMKGYALKLDRGGPKLKACKLEDCPREYWMTSISKAGVAGGSERIQARTTGKLAQYLSTVLKEPVVDMTGLDGTYSIQLNTHDPLSTGVTPGGGGRINIGGQPVDIPESTPSVFEAVKKLGLRLDHERLTIRSLVVDHVEQTPTEN
ncbi:MAG TPA: TIGR03435 family protein [Bryobacteraceae bacterium]|nr:TIGR03435 family protein [Bryobacteraceae bacterium]